MCFSPPPPVPPDGAEGEGAEVDAEEPPPGLLVSLDFEFDFEGLHGFDDGEFALHMEEKMEGVQERIEEAMERLEEMDFGDFGDHHVFTFRSSPRFEINRGNWFVHEDLDANEDGEISEEEFLNARSKLFDRLDENGDGVLDEDEMDDLGFHGNFVFDWNDDEDDD